MAYHVDGSGKNEGRIAAEIEFTRILRKRNYPHGKQAIKNLEAFFENRIKTMYANAPKTWKDAYTRTVFARIQRLKKSAKSRSPEKWKEQF